MGRIATHLERPGFPGPQTWDGEGDPVGPVPEPAEYHFVPETNLERRTVAIRSRSRVPDRDGHPLLLTGIEAVRKFQFEGDPTQGNFHLDRALGGLHEG